MGKSSAKMRLFLGLAIACVALGVGQCACLHNIPCGASPEDQLKRACQEAEDIGYTYSSENNFCYKVHYVKLKWANARQQCEYEGGLLAKVDTTSKHELINSVITYDSHYFLGATDSAEDGVWRWIADNSVMSGFSKSGGKDCLEIIVDEDESEFDHASCTSLHRYICEIPLPS